MSEPIPVTLKCDTPKCGWNEAIDFAAAKKHVGRSCPQCGVVVLTAADYALTAATLAIMPLLNLGVADPASKTGILNINPHDGKVVVRPIFRGEA